MKGLQADGILGMAPKVQSGDNAQLYVENLFKNGLIGHNSFGVNYNSLNEASTITLGGYDKNIVANDTLFAFITLKDTYYWSLPHEGATYGGLPLDLSATRAILDTGTSLTYFSTSDFEKVYSKISDGKKCGYSSSTGFRACECNSIDDFQDITFEFGSYVLYFPASAYVTVSFGSPNV